MSVEPPSDGLEPPIKRRKLTAESATSIVQPSTEPSCAQRTPVPRGLDRPITPPPSRRTQSSTLNPSVSQLHGDDKQSSPLHQTADGHRTQPCRYITSPVRLTRIRDLSSSQNVDTIGLGDILGDPMIKECWNFNFLFDLNFVMKHFDPDVRDLIKIKIIHGFWKQEDERRIALLESSEAYPNIQLISAYMPDPFGTHHTKMLILFRHDGQAQVVIHTANMISRDWGNMTQAVWRSPLLALWDKEENVTVTEPEPCIHAIGSGERFKLDLLRYLERYGKRLGDLTTQLREYNFDAVRAAFIGSAPSRQKVRFAKPSSQTSWGWLGLREILSTIPVHAAEPDPESSERKRPNIVMQVSSIATLGQTPAWLNHFQSVLSRHSSKTSSSATERAGFQSANHAFFAKRGVGASTSGSGSGSPTFNIIFPTAHEIRTSLDGYNSGGSIHMRLQSAAQQKQLEYMRPLLCHWKHLSGSDDPSSSTPRKAGRGAAAPHIKTYIRFSDQGRQEIDWALVTSANLSKQAWGEVENKNGEIWIQSWECGVIVWPGLFSEGDDSGGVKMAPVFGKDTPTEDDVKAKGADKGKGDGKMTVGFRMPYDLPLERYQEGEVPWCASMAHDEPDWKGQMWGG